MRKQKYVAEAEEAYWNFKSENSKNEGVVLSLLSHSKLHETKDCSTHFSISNVRDSIWYLAGSRCLLPELINSFNNPMRLSLSSYIIQEIETQRLKNLTSLAMEWGEVWI